AIVVYTSSENAWASKEGQPGPSWWQVDLGEPQAVREVRVWYRSLAGVYGFVPKAVTLQLSDDGKAWRTVLANSTAVPREGAAYERTPSRYDLQSQGRFVRLLFEQGTQRPGSTVVEVTEVEVY
ncbi:MAG: discoidin domain-containing protein, partial [Lentisphaerae bacterium]|nr:discoidin domain-containing protein [Lentisphaerota bacterium]